MGDRSGELIGDYLLLRRIDAGTFGAVYEAEQRYLKTRVALKLLTAKLETEQFERFQEEARTIAALDHPHIIRIITFSLHQQEPYLVMSLAAGSLKGRFPPGTPVPLQTLLPFALQAAAGLQHAHEQHIAHLDIKPANLLLSTQQQVLVADFGIAVTLQTQQTHASFQGFAGTPAYAAPEQFQNRPGLASDQYALAVLVYQWLTGQLPFAGDWWAIGHQKMTTDPPRLQATVPGLAPVVEQVVLKAMAKDPKERFASVQAFAIALLHASQAGEPSTILSPAFWVGSAIPTASPASALTSHQPGDRLAEAIGAAPPPPIPASGGNPASPLEAPSMRNSGPLQQVNLPPGRSSARSSPLLADGETKRAKIWTPRFTSTFLALFLVGTILGGWARIADGFDAFHNFSDETFVYHYQHLSPPFLALLFLCEGFLVIFPIVGLWMTTSNLTRVGLLLQAGIGGVSLIRSLLYLSLNGYYDPLTQMDLVFLEFRSLPLLMSGLLALSVLCFSYGLAPWRFPSDLGWTLLQVVGSVVGGILVLNTAIRTGIYALIEGTFPENGWVLVLAAGTFATFASLVVLLRPACWKRSWSLTLGLALGGGGVMLLLTLGYDFFSELPYSIGLTDYPTFFAPYVLIALACILVVRSERLHQKKLTKQTTF